MCRYDDTTISRTKNSIGDGASDSSDNRIRSMLPPSVVSQSHSSSNNGEDKASLSPPRPSSLSCATTTTEKTAETIESILPSVVWLEHVLPFLDRPAWNALMEASREIYKLAVVSRLTAEHKNLVGPVVGQPPWPTNTAFQTKKGGQGLAIESMTLSHDGEFLACGSEIGSIEIWNLRSGKLRWKGGTDDYAEARAQCPNYYAPPSLSSENPSGRRSRVPTTGSMERRSTPLGSIVKFSPEGYTLACGFENRIFVWDLEQTLLRRGGLRKTMVRNARNLCTNHRAKAASCAFPPHPQLPDDRPESVAQWLYERQQRAHQQRDRQHAKRQREEGAAKEESACQILDIVCYRGVMYDVTYLGFSNANGTAPAGNRLIARYGKMAYIWTKQRASFAAGRSNTGGCEYVLSHQIALTSSRCQIATDPSLTFLAVATNGSGGAGAAAASARRRRVGEGARDGSSSTDASSPTSEDRPASDGGAKALDGKGIIHVWELRGTTTANDEADSREQPVRTVASETGTRIVAYRHHVVRGLECLEVGGGGASGSDATCLVSASLQGEVKFWKAHRPYYKTNLHGHDEMPPEYVCVYRFQSPGKIFSMALWSSFSLSGYENPIEPRGRILLAAGEAHGMVRVWRVSAESLSSASSSSCAAASCDSLELFDGRVRSNVVGVDNTNNDDKQQRLEECLSTEVGGHVHYDNIKLLAFTPNGRSLAVSRAYDSKIYFQTVWQ